MKRYLCSAILTSLFLSAIPASAASVRFQSFVRWPVESDCPRPDVVATINTRDLQAYAYYEVAQLQVGDVIRGELVAPTGAVARTRSFTVTASLASFSYVCDTISLSSNADPYVPAVGQWVFRLFSNGTPIGSYPVRVEATTPPPLTLGTYVTTGSANSTCAAPPAKASFLTTDGSARLWWHYPSIPGRTQLKAAFSGPNGQSYSEFFGAAGFDGDWCYWKDFDFTTVPAAALPGRWTVRVTADDKESFTTAFTVRTPGPQVTLSETTSTPAPGGGTYILNFTSTGSWTVVTDVSWIRITTPLAGTGNGYVECIVEANTTRTVRTGTVTVGGQTLFVTQPPAAAVDPVIPLKLTSQGIAAGFRLTMFIDRFDPISTIGPIGIEFPNAGGVLVSEFSGDVRHFPNRADGQHADTAPVRSQYNYGGGMAKSGGRIYLADLQGLIRLKDDGTHDQVVFRDGFEDGVGLVTNPLNGHLFLSIRPSGGTHRLVDIDPVTKAVTTFKSGVSVDGLSFTPDGKTLYAAEINTGRIIGFRTSDSAQVFDSGPIAGGPDGALVGGGKLAGLLFVNCNDGRVVQVDLATKVQTVIATGGSRGDLIAVDPFDGSLLLTQSDSIVRLGPADGSTFAPPTVISVTNGAEFSSAVSPGSLTTLFGSGFSRVIRQFVVPPFPTTADGVAVTVNGRAAHLNCISPSQVNFQIPSDIQGAEATVLVNNNGIISAPVAFRVTPTAPGIFQDATGRAIAQRSHDYSLVTPSNPAPVDSVVVVYFTGIGPTSPSVPDGEPAPFSPLAQATSSHSATVGGLPAQVLYMGLTSGFSGLGQANVRIPAALATGDYPIVLTINGQASRALPIAVRR
jgi:uncharacterized protein (TIGR03437 family)